jgi:hypothetical protein
LECAGLLALSVQSFDQQVFEKHSKAAASCRIPKKPALLFMPLCSSPHFSQGFYCGGWLFTQKLEAIVEKVVLLHE